MARAALLIVSVLLEMFLLHSSTSSAVSPCPAGQRCVPDSARVRCHYGADYNWLETHLDAGKLVLPDNALFVNTPEKREKTGAIYLARFHSVNGATHLTTIQSDGTIDFDNDGEIASKFQVLCNGYPLESNVFSFHPVWPGSMRSSEIRGSPNVREAAIIVAEDDNRHAFLGKVAGSGQIFGTVVRNPDGKNELVYRDADRAETRTENFVVLVSKQCIDSYHYVPDDIIFVDTFELNDV